MRFVKALPHDPARSLVIQKPLHVIGLICI